MSKIKTSSSFNFPGLHITAVPDVLQHMSIVSLGKCHVPIHIFVYSGNLLHMQRKKKVDLHRLVYRPRGDGQILSPLSACFDLKQEF